MKIAVKAMTHFVPEKFVVGLHGVDDADISDLSKTGVERITDGCELRAAGLRRAFVAEVTQGVFVRPFLPFNGARRALRERVAGSEQQAGENDGVAHDGLPRLVGKIILRRVASLSTSAEVVYG